MGQGRVILNHIYSPGQKQEGSHSVLPSEVAAPTDHQIVASSLAFVRLRLAPSLFGLEDEDASRLAAR